MLLPVLLFSSIFLGSRAQHMTLCDYFEKLGLAKPECGHQIRQPAFHGFVPNYEAPNYAGAAIQTNNLRFGSYPEAAVDTSQLIHNLPLCRNYFHSCMSSDACESGTICTNGVEQGSCCTNPHRAQCPTVTKMHISCRKTRSVNWCNSDMDCRGTSTTASMCCPTGCNYNMCIHVGQQIFHPRRSVVFSSLANTNLGLGLSPGLSLADQCPDPYQLDVKCVATKGANWCYTDADCRSGLYTRKCCATLCGYNTCLMHFNDKWIIA